MISPDGTIEPVPAGAAGVNTTVAAWMSGTLVLAEAAGGWSATINGKPLASVAQPVDGWAQGFVLPTGGGHLVITRNDTARDLSLAVELLAILVASSLALPGTRAAAAAAAAESEPESAAAPGRRRDRSAGPEPDRRKRPGFALASLRPGGGPDTEATEPAKTGSVPGFTADDEPWSEPEPELANQPRAEPDSGYPVTAGAPAADQQAAARLQPVVAKRPRGGQHAARHGKPSRRSRGPDLENLDLVPADEAPARRSRNPRRRRIR